MRQLASFYNCSFFEIQERLNAGDERLIYWWSVSTDAEREAKQIYRELHII